MIHPLAFSNNLIGMDGLVVLVISLLIFSRRLPEVGQNLGKAIVEFKKGLNGTANDKTHRPDEFMLFLLGLSAIIALLALLLWEIQRR